MVPDRQFGTDLIRVYMEVKELLAHYFSSHVQRLSHSHPKNLQGKHEYVSSFLEYLEFIFSKKCIGTSLKGLKKHSH